MSAAAALAVLETPSEAWERLAHAADKAQEVADTPAEIPETARRYARKRARDHRLMLVDLVHAFRPRSCAERFVQALGPELAP